VGGSGHKDKQAILDLPRTLQKRQSRKYGRRKIFILCTADYFLIRRATFWCITPSKVCEGCRFFRWNSNVVSENGTERRGFYDYPYALGEKRVALF
jgi:hypothetical protein